MSNKVLLSSLADMAGIHPGVCGQHSGEPPQRPSWSQCCLFSSASPHSILLQTKCFVLSTLKRCKFTVIKFLHFSPFILSLLVSNSSPHSCLTPPHICTLLLLERKETHMHFLVQKKGGMSMVRTRFLCLALNVRSVDRKRRDWL
jgi:hypothetical protein